MPLFRWGEDDGPMPVPLLGRARAAREQLHACMQKGEELTDRIMRLQQQRTALRRELGDVRGEVASLSAEVLAEGNANAVLLRRLEAVHELHVPGPVHRDRCSRCNSRWPCRTVRLLIDPA